MIKKISENEFIETQISHVINGDEIKTITYFKNGNIHNDNGPAKIYYYENGNIECECYYINNKLHREDGPAKIYYYENGKKKYERYFINDEPPKEGLIQKNYFRKSDNIQGKLYMENGVLYTEKYYYNGNVKTQIINYGEKKIEICFYDTGIVNSIRFMKNGHNHSDDDKPAVMVYHENGNIKYEIYYVDGKLHRESYPAKIEYDEYGNVIHENYYWNQFSIVIKKNDYTFKQLIRYIEKSNEAVTFEKIKIIITKNNSYTDEEKRQLWDLLDAKYLLLKLSS